MLLLQTETYSIHVNLCECAFSKNVQSVKIFHNCRIPPEEQKIENQRVKSIVIRVSWQPPAQRE